MLSCIGIESFYTVSHKNACTNFETVPLKIIKIDFDDIWQKYSKYSRIEFVCSSFHVGLLFYQLFVFETEHRKAFDFVCALRDLQNVPFSSSVGAYHLRDD